jgi:hypothetical protein
MNRFRASSMPEDLSRRSVLPIARGEQRGAPLSYGSKRAEREPDGRTGGQMMSMIQATAASSRASRLTSASAAVRYRLSDGPWRQFGSGTLLTRVDDRLLHHVSRCARWLTGSYAQRRNWPCRWSISTRCRRKHPVAGMIRLTSESGHLPLIGSAEQCHKPTHCQICAIDPKRPFQSGRPVSLKRIKILRDRLLRHLAGCVN